MNKNKKIALIASVVFAIMIVVSATFAWLTFNDTKVNSFKGGQIADGTVVINELFNPNPKPWQPGDVVDKEVTVSNNGEVDVFVRVSYEEILQKLKNDGAQKLLGSKNGQPGDIPVKMSISGYTSPEWTKVTDALGLPAGAEVLKSTTASGTNGYVIYHKLPNNEFQKMEATFDDSSGRLNVTEAQYYFFSGLGDAVGIDWAGTNKYLGTDTKVPGGAPTVLQPKGKEGHSALDSNFEFNYSEDLKDAITADKWFYNYRDGYFYYIGVLKPGAKPTPVLLKSIRLNPAGVNDSYALLEYDLAVLLEAVQNFDSALTGEASEWNMSDSDPVYAALQEFARQ